MGVTSTLHANLIAAHQAPCIFPYDAQTVHSVPKSRMDKAVDPETDFRTYTRFENKDDFIALRDQILTLDIYTEPTEAQRSAEWDVYKKISLIVGCPRSSVVLR